MLALYQRQIVKCRTINQYNGLHIALSNRITPLELAEIGKAIEHSYPFPAAKQWLENHNNWAQLSGKAEPEPFVRRRLKPNLYLYSNGRSTSEKTLVVCFTGNARRLMMPLPTFLQHLDSTSFDVLLLYRHGDTFYSNGVRGLADSFDGLMQVLRTTFGGFSYRRVVSYGTSSGGVPAILTALYLGLEKGISVGGRRLEDERWVHIKSEEWFKRAKDRRHGKPQLLSVFAAKNRKDRDCAAEMQKLLPITLCPLADQKDHSAIFKYVLSGKFKELLESLLTVQKEEAVSPN